MEIKKNHTDALLSLLTSLQQTPPLCEYYLSEGHTCSRKRVEQSFREAEQSSEAVDAQSSCLKSLQKFLLTMSALLQRGGAEWLKSEKRAGASQKVCDKENSSAG